MVKNLLLISALLAIPFSASAQSTNPATDMNPKTEMHPSEQKLSSNDESFLNDAAQAGLAEIEGGKLAQQKAKTSEVKDFATNMITDHTKVGDELKQLAAKKGVTVPTEPSLLQKGELKALSLLDDKFDENYVDRMAVAAHENTVELFKKTADEAEDGDIKVFAQKTLPALEEHLKMAKALHPTVSKTQ
ncbi:hypothetical protein W822_05840 [Advenella kashmirensis W13003]|uniref:DUF4142 domain-containing protein n=1 Tax=Advenella kashmirensis W13003 TaxID=1424334 RepID=V8QX70_9BURK|nr:DUF4142 domain-containing protein [Advenella kashmirensis]ETF03599.1 hypothetical protein W822_05840 [Advenella kashmirensis W13003]